MLTSEFKNNLKKTGQVLFIVLITGLLLIWLNQGSLERFWQQKYHQDTPWSKMMGNPVWSYGSALHDGVQEAGLTFAYHASGQKAADDKQAAQIADSNDALKFPDDFRVGLHFVNGYIYPAESLSVTFPELLKRPQARAKNSTRAFAGVNLASPEGPITPKHIAKITAGDQVLFAGDSMMQGIAPHVKNMLLKKYNIDSINLSKQSTGLAYPRFFNWPETIAKALNDNPNIKVLVVFLGPNDPWDMPPQTGYKYVKFKSEEWEQVYRSRINDILATARQHNVDVIWVGPPNMRKNNLSDGMKFLRSLYQSEVEKYGEMYISANDVFKYKNDDYSDYIGDGSNAIKLRSGDGVHFSGKGQQMIAERVFSLIHFEEGDKEPHETEQLASSQEQATLD
ncbi:SGNH/GDSL hydrolase family protein [Providencia rustigianii]|uniref:SGNH/GDSL hydrolase family protein n=1 Tax=Providencia rustigianii TaxID=158850 RepID=UPI00223EB8DA|nr:SGNH family hydrolase [Providencia rustigianii]